MGSFIRITFTIAAAITIVTSPLFLRGNFNSLKFANGDSQLNLQFEFNRPSIGSSYNIQAGTDVVHVNAGQTVGY